MRIDEPTFAELRRTEVARTTDVPEACLDLFQSLSANCRHLRAGNLAKYQGDVDAPRHHIDTQSFVPYPTLYSDRRR